MLIYIYANLLLGVKMLFVTVYPSLQNLYVKIFTSNHNFKENVKNLYRYFYIQFVKKFSGKQINKKSWYQYHSDLQKIRFIW